MGVGQGKERLLAAGCGRQYVMPPQIHRGVADVHGGVAIEDVWEGSPAQKLGIQVGDILVQFSYNRILSVADFQKWLYMYGVGQPVKLYVLRNGTEYLVADYVIEERPQ